MSGTSEAVEPFVLSVAQVELDDLRQRLVRTRWPEKQTVGDWSQGAPLQDVQALCAHWRDHYDWRRCEAMLNGFGQFRTAIDGLGIHFLHVRSPEPDALPMLMTHGWPGSVIEFHQVIGPLTDPGAHGGDPRDAFHLVLPSLPGFGFSDKPQAAGWGVDRIAGAWGDADDAPGVSPLRRPGRRLGRLRHRRHRRGPAGGLRRHPPQHRERPPHATARRRTPIRRSVRRSR